MSLKEVLQLDWKAAVKAKDKFTSGILNLIRAEIQQVEKESTDNIDDETVMEIIAREIKQKRDARDEFISAGRNDLVETADKEIEILLRYLPKQLNREEILEIVSDAAKSVGANSMKDMGKLMSVVIPKTKGKADGKLVNTIVKEYLN